MVFVSMFFFHNEYKRLLPQGYKTKVYSMISAFHYMWGTCDSPYTQFLTQIQSICRQLSELTVSQAINLGLFQTEIVCRRQFKI